MQYIYHKTFTWKSVDKALNLLPRYQNLEVKMIFMLLFKKEKPSISYLTVLEKYCITAVVSDCQYLVNVCLFRHRFTATQPSPDCLQSTYVLTVDVAFCTSFIEPYKHIHFYLLQLVQFVRQFVSSVHFSQFQIILHCRRHICSLILKISTRFGFRYIRFVIFLGKEF